MRLKSSATAPPPLWRRGRMREGYVEPRFIAAQTARPPRLFSAAGTPNENTAPITAILCIFVQFFTNQDQMAELTIDNYLERHYIHRSNWLRAAVLGANDGIISISSLAIGVAAASAAREPILLATVAGLVAGALSMAAGEYVSVSSQTDTEQADIERERQELAEAPEEELQILAQIYERRGLTKATAMQVAKELTEKDALGAHIREELGINEISHANPIQAAIASGAAFTVGGALPLLVVLFAPVSGMEYWLYGFTIVFLVILGAISAKTGGASVGRAVVRISVWGTIAMLLSAGVGYVFGVSV